MYLPYKTVHNTETVFKYSNSIEPICNSQLICSGAVQYCASTESSRNLLEYWQNIIEYNNGAADDYCLDFAFNNFNSTHKLNYYWLPKAYARYAWWIFDEPVIDHPQIPNTSTKWKEATDLIGRKRFYSDQFTASVKNENKYNGIILSKSKIHANRPEDGDIEFNVINKKIWIDGYES